MPPIISKPFYVIGGSGPALDANTMLLVRSDSTNGNTTFTDISPNARTLNRFGDTQHSTALSYFGTSSARFDGNGDYIEIDASPTDLDILGDHTLEAWCYYPGANAGAIFSCVNFQSAQYTSFGLYTWTDGKMYYRIVQDNDTSTYATSPTSIPTGVWFHVAGVRSGSTMTLYINGSSVATNTISVPMQDSFSHTVKIGAHNYGPVGDHYNFADSYLNAYLDEIRVSNIARWTSNFTPETTFYT